MQSIETWKAKAREIRSEVQALYLAMSDPRVPWYAKALAACVVGYALSPIDLIPDFIPVLGYLDDLILLPIGIVIVMKMIPGEVLAECRLKAKAADGGVMKWVVACLIVVLWAALALWAISIIRSVRA